MVLSVPVIALAMIPVLQFTYWQWISLTLAARHGAASACGAHHRSRGASLCDPAFSVSVAGGVNERSGGE